MSEKVTVHYPEYYSKFACIGSRCEDTCCANWQISADPASLNRYRREKGPFRKQLHAGMNLRTGMFHMKDGRCPFLNGENLCEMYIRTGKDSLCKTCRDFPRHVEDYGYLKEIGLSLACPEAARLILSGNGKDLRMKTKTVKAVSPIDNEEFLDFLLKLRDVFFYLLEYGTVPGQEEEPSMRLKTAMILSLARDVQRRLDRGEEGPVELFGRYTKKGVFEKYAVRLEDYLLGSVRRTENGLGLQVVPEKAHEIRGVVLKYLDAIEELEPVSEKWRHLTKECRMWLERADQTELLSSGRFLEDNMLEALLTYYLYSWLLGAVYDWEPYTQVKMAVVSCILVEVVCRYLWTGKGEKRELLVYVSHLWARELEHSDANLGKMEDLLWGDGRFSFEKMLCCILF